MKDGDLRSLFRGQFKLWHWSSIETAGTASGVPDSEFCTPFGIQGWIEFKQTHINRVRLGPFQVGWIDKRSRYGGNVWIAVRRQPNSQREAGIDDLWLIHGSQVCALAEGGLENITAMCWHDGPNNWNWGEIGNILKGLAS
jgi:hypothetical protein